MGWSPAFVRAIEDGVTAPRYLLEVLHSDGFRPLDYLTLSSHDESGQWAQVIQGTGTGSAAMTHVGDWSSTMSELRINVVWFADIRNQIARGTIVQLKMGFAGWSTGDFQPIFTGHVQSITRLPGEQWSISIRSIVASLSTRLTQLQNEGSLFHTLPYATSIATANYTAGDATLNVGATASAERETGGQYLIRITPSTAGLDPFYLFASGKTATTFTGCSALGQLGTLAVSSLIGDTVEALALIQDHPIDAIRKIVCSTGAGTNGAFDTLPDSWGIGIPDAAWDHDDAEWTKVLVAPVGVPDAAWDLFADAPAEDALSWLIGVMAPAGLFFTMHQGRLTIRGGSTQSQHRSVTGGMITDNDIVSIDRYDTWDPASPIEYSEVTASTVSGSGVSLSSLDSRPSGSNVELSLPYITGNQSGWRDNVLERLAGWYTHVPEVLDITCVGWRLATMAPGDHVVLRSKMWLPRDGMDPGFLVLLSVDPDWFGATTRLRAAYLPFVTEYAT